MDGDLGIRLTMEIFGVIMRLMGVVNLLTKSP